MDLSTLVSARIPPMHPSRRDRKIASVLRRALGRELAAEAFVSWATDLEQNWVVESVSLRLNGQAIEINVYDPAAAVQIIRQPVTGNPALFRSLPSFAASCVYTA